MLFDSRDVSKFNSGRVAHELIPQMMREALDFAERTYGINHPIWTSIHDQIESFRIRERDVVEHGLDDHFDDVNDDRVWTESQSRH